MAVGLSVLLCFIFCVWMNLHSTFWDLNDELEELKIFVICDVGGSGQDGVYKLIMVQKDGCDILLVFVQAPLIRGLLL